jgi:hypothetical protein
MAVAVAGMQLYNYRLTLVISVGHSTPSNTLYYTLVVVDYILLVLLHYTLVVVDYILLVLLQSSYVTTMYYIQPIVPVRPPTYTLLLNHAVLCTSMYYVSIYAYYYV